MIYKTFEDVTGFFVTKPLWKELENEFPYFMDQIKKKLVLDYMEKYKILKVRKDAMIKEFDVRADY